MRKSRERPITVPNNGRYRLVVGIDFNHPGAPNVIGHIRLANYKEKVAARCPTEEKELWLTLKDFDRLGTLLLI